MVDTRSKMQLSDLNSEPHVRKSLRNLIDRTIGVCFYPPPVSQNHKLLCLDKFHEYTHINDNHRKIMRQNSHELYNVLHQTCAGKLRIEILSLTTFNQLYYMKKYCAFVKLFVRLWINQWMNITCVFTYMTAHNMRITSHIIKLRLQYHTNLHK